MDLNIAIILLVISTVTMIAAFPPFIHSPSKLYQPQHVTIEPAQLLKAFGLGESGIRRWETEPPQYMLDLYNQLADSNDGVSRQPAPYGSSIIRAFSETRSVGDNDGIFSFVLSGLEEDILEVEFHIYHSRLSKHQRHLLKDNIYQMEVACMNESDEILISKQDIAGHSSGWRIFRLGNNVIQCTDIQDNGKVLLHLQVTAYTLDGNQLQISLHHGTSTRGARHPILVLFSTFITNTDPDTSIKHTEMNMVNGISSKRIRRSSGNVNTSIEAANPVTVVPIVPHGCDRRDMLVDFDKIGWSTWIVHPKVYNAYRCVGQCSFPMGQNLNPTNHATVQSIIHHSGEFPDIRGPCCVPSLYANLTLLYYDSDENVVLKQYDKMVATQCGCH